MFKRQKTDPRQLCFVFEEGGDGGAKTGAEFPPTQEREPGEIREAAGRVEPSSEKRDARPPDIPPTASPVPPPGTPAAVAAAYAAKAPLSGPDPGLTALCASWLNSLDADMLGKKLKVVWNRRFTSAAGVARYGPNRIELNPALTQFEGEIERTLRHEVAHLLARFRNPTKKIQPHGAEWRRACAELGIPGEPIYHSLPFTSRRRKRSHAYRCASCTQVITRVRPLRGYCACYTCCKKFNRGRYDAKFKLEKVPVPEG